MQLNLSHWFVPFVTEDLVRVSRLSSLEFLYIDFDDQHLQEENSSLLDPIHKAKFMLSMLL